MWRRRRSRKRGGIASGIICVMGIIGVMRRICWRMFCGVGRDVGVLMGYGGGKYAAAACCQMLERRVLLAGNAVVDDALGALAGEFSAWKADKNARPTKAGDFHSKNSFMHISGVRVAIE